MARTALTSGASGLIALATNTGVAAPASPQAADATQRQHVAFTTGSSYGAVPGASWPWGTATRRPTRVILRGWRVHGGGGGCGELGDPEAAEHGAHPVHGR